MSTRSKGYSGYRGRKKGKKVLLAVALVLLVLLCGGFLLVQNYVTYDDSGKMHFDLPFFDRQEEEPAISGEEVNLDIIVPEEEEETVKRLPVKELHARTVGTMVLSRDPEKTIAAVPEEDIVIEVKRVIGSITYASEAEIPEEVEVAGGETMENFKAILAGEKYVVARMSTFCDSYFVRAYRDAALCRENGGYWYDGDSRTWLDPTHPQTLAYITALCQELAALGVDELMLDNFAYPTTGNVSAIYGLEEVDKEKVLADFAATLRANLPEGTVLGIVLRQDLESDDGIDAALISEHFDRVYVTENVDLSALRTALEGYGAERIVPFTGKAPETGSYLLY